MTAAECAAFLADFGHERIRGEFGPATSRLGPEIYRIYQAASENPGNFYLALSECAQLARDGWAWVGASRVATEVGLDGVETDPGFVSLATMATNFLRARNIPRMYITGYESRVWATTSADGSVWLEPLPALEVDPPVTDLQEGEEREIARLDGLGNRLRVRHVDGRYLVTMHRVQSDTDPTLVPDDDPASVSSSIADAYRATAAGLGSPPPWCDPELEPFFRYGRPDFSR